MFSTRSLITLFQVQNCGYNLKTISKVFHCQNWRTRASRINGYSTIGAGKDDNKRIPRRYKKRMDNLKNIGENYSHEFETHQHEKNEHETHNNEHELEHGEKKSELLAVNRPQASQYIDNMLEQTRPERPPKIDFPSDMTEYYKWKRNQEKHSYRPAGKDPSLTSIMLFPGQGSQFLGMGKNLLDHTGAKEMYDRASHILGYDLLELCINGPVKELHKTEHCQPAVFVTSLAALEKLKEEKPEMVDSCVGAAGFSVGEFAALVFAGVMTFEDALKVLKVRAESMQAASEEVQSGMMTMFLNHQSKLGFALKCAKEFCKTRLNIEQPVCEIANYLFTDCKVIAGHQEALDFIKENGKDFGLMKFKQLAVSGAFHTPLMEKVITPLMKELKKIEIQKPKIHVHKNINGKSFRLQDVKKDLCNQLVMPVKWEQTMHILYTRQGGGFPKTFEVGPGRQLGLMLKKTNAKAYLSYEKVDV